MSETITVLTNEVPGFVEDLTLLPIPPWWQSPWFLAAVLVLVVGLLLAAVRWFPVVRRGLVSRRRRAAGPGPGEPPEVWARRRLDELAAQARSLGPYRLATECSWVLRLYLETRFALPIIFQTTREFLEHIRSGEVLGEEARGALGRYLAGCDRVKFGRGRLDDSQTEALLTEARAFVNLGAAVPSPLTEPPRAPARPVAAPG
jgi:hypothetical protein